MCTNEFLLDACGMRTGAPQCRNLDPVLFLKQTIELLYAVESVSVLSVDVQMMLNFMSLLRAWLGMNINPGLFSSH